MADAYSERHGAGFLRGILDRFRGTAGVPATVSDDLTAELAPLFLILESVEAEAQAIRTAALRRATTIADEARAETERILTDAKEQAEVERAEAIKAGRRAADAEMRAIETAAADDAAEIGRTGRVRIAPLVDQVVRCLEQSPR